MIFQRHEHLSGAGFTIPMGLESVPVFLVFNAQIIVMLASDCITLVDEKPGKRDIKSILHKPYSMVATVRYFS